MFALPQASNYGRRPALPCPPPPTNLLTACVLIEPAGDPLEAVDYPLRLFSLHQLPL